MPHWKIILAYDGQPYNGWQIQPDQPTIQGTLAETILRITGESILPQGSGRTDTGVHALAQVASFSLNAPIPAVNLHRALNHGLPASIRVLSVEEVSHTFHARHSSRRKTYEYRILPGDVICPPMLAPYVWACRSPLNLDTLNHAAAAVVGTHDFTSFAAAVAEQPMEEETQPCSSACSGGSTVAVAAVRGNVRTIFHSSWRREDDLLIYSVTGSGFLHHMVRNLVGTFYEVAIGRRSTGSIPDILEACRRSAAGSTAPARGLFLVKVDY